MNIDSLNRSGLKANSLSDFISVLRTCETFPVESALEESALLQWLLATRMFDRQSMGSIVMLGDVPFPIVSFSESLSAIGINSRTAGALADQRVELINLEAVIIGRNNWHEQSLLSLINRSTARGDGGTVDGISCRDENGTPIFTRSAPDYIPRLYSQEMLLYRILTGRNPLAKGEAFLFRHIRAHPGLCFLDAHRGFEWVSLGLSYSERNLKEAQFTRCGNAWRFWLSRRAFGTE